jgi:hypothetical protein
VQAEEKRDKFGVNVGDVCKKIFGASFKALSCFITMKYNRTAAFACI